MARPERNTVDYFPFICEDGKKMFYLEEKYGNDGFATFLKILRELAKTDYHYLDLSKNITKMFLSAKCKISKDLLGEIIQDLVDLEKFDRVLWEDNTIIWCQDFIDNIQDAYSKRKNKCITYEGLLTLLLGLGVRKPSKRPLNSPIKPQSIVEHTKVEESIVDNIKKEERFSFRKELINYGFEEGLVEDWLKVRKTKKATNTQTAYNGFISQVEKTGKDKNFILRTCIEKSWSGFKVEWLEEKKKEGRKTGSQELRDALNNYTS